MSTKDEIVSAVDAEITKAKRRLDVVYNEVEDMKTQRTALQGEIANLDKHIKYLNEVSLAKNEEIKLKQKTVDSLDPQIQDKQKEVNELQGKVSESNSVLEKNRDELREIEAKKAEHSETITREREEHIKIRQNLTLEGSSIEEKKAKISKLISEL